MIIKSLPSRERGLKYFRWTVAYVLFFVAPLAGAWIEMMTIRNVRCLRAVAPLAGAWIEIYTGDLAEIIPPVAPLAGAWIEMRY